MKTLVFSLVLLSGATGFAEGKGDAQRVIGCVKLFVKTDAPDKKDRSVASAQEYVQYITTEIDKEGDVKRLHFISGYLMGILAQKDDQVRERLLFKLASTFKDFDIRKLIDDNCAK